MYKESEEDKRATKGKLLYPSAGLGRGSIDVDQVQGIEMVLSKWMLQVFCISPSLEPLEGLEDSTTQ